MQETFNKLNLLGYTVDQYLVGLNQFISKEIIVVRHESMPADNFGEGFEEETRLLPNGMILHTEKPRFWNYNFISDVVLQDGVKTRTWRSNGFSNALQMWAVGADASTSYSKYSRFCGTISNEDFIELIDMLYDKIVSFVNVEDAPQFLTLMLNTDFNNDAFMAEISNTYSAKQVEKFIDAVEKCNQMSLPVSDYREVFNYSQTN